MVFAKRFLACSQMLPKPTRFVAAKPAIGREVALLRGPSEAPA